MSQQRVLIQVVALHFLHNYKNITKEHKTKRETKIKCHCGEP